MSDRSYTGCIVPRLLERKPFMSDAALPTVPDNDVRRDDPAWPSACILESVRNADESRFMCLCTTAAFQHQHSCNLWFSTSGKPITEPGLADHLPMIPHSFAAMSRNVRRTNLAGFHGLVALDTRVLELPAVHD